MILAMLLLYLPGCSRQPELWVPGLSLPAGATLLSREEHHGPQGAMPSTMPNALTGEYLSVEFDYEGDWEAIVAHFDGQLLKKGYHDSLRALQQGAKATGAVDDTRGLLSHTLQYERDGSGYRVTVMDPTKLDEAVTSSGQGHYRLVVWKTVRK